MRLTFDELTKEVVPPDWLVPGLLCHGTMVVLAGEPGVGKSSLSYTLAVAKAAGSPFLGRPTIPGRVLYFDEENSFPDLREYINWVWRGLGCPDPTLVQKNLFIESFSLGGPNWHSHMALVTKEIQPELIIIDTATPACNIVNENDNGEASAIIHHLRRIRALAGPRATCLILKHARMNHETNIRDIRGAKAWKGETDATWLHVANTGRPRKDGLQGSKIIPAKVRAFGLRDVLSIHPTWVQVDGNRGLKLEASHSPEDQALDSPRKLPGVSSHHKYGNSQIVDSKA
jgi:AAA domain-containing protein